MKFKIKEAREKANLTQTELAARIGVAPNTFCGYENGLHDPKSKLLVKIAAECGTTVDFLLGLDETKKSPAPEGTEDEEQAIDELEEELRSVLLKHGLLHGGDITPDQNAFLKHVFALILAYFQKSI